MTYRELKDVHESKFPEKEFTAKLIETSIKQVGKNNPKPEVVFTFEGKEEPQEIAFRGLEKLIKVKTENEEPIETISDFFQLGKLIASLRKHGVKPLIDDEAGSFKTEPNLIGKVLHMKPVNERTVTGETGTNTYRDWIIEEIKDNSKTIVAPGTPAQPQKPAGLTPELKQKWEDFLIENLTSPATMTGIQRLLQAKITDSTKRGSLADVRNLAIKALKEEGFLKVDDETKGNQAQYSVA